MPEAFTRHAVSRIAARRVAHDWPWAREAADFVTRNWARRMAERPGIFDGRVFLACGWEVTEGACRLDLFETRYACFLGHRDAGSPDGGVKNVFAAVVPRSADGAVILGIMGGHTANAGQAYFPCGTPDLDDLRADGRVDLAGSAAREFTEETGMAVPDGAPERWTLWQGDGQLAFLREIDFPEDADTLVARMDRHRRAEAAPELAGFTIARRTGDIDPARMPGFVRAALGHAFGG
ncbi:hypothetical protein [Methylobacterium sp. Leaf466]|uniref:hypothetical protein n=1 Tax=Methylobacterium sp. Leaf466 TaxID=1736386 RepID=UPI0006FD4A38|nr:hypothetical protein [Methylobacterium sp. Leaf466]KQT77925.1 NUDIX hydrolase [Methylobacterium sp. Leaf466]